MVVLPCFTLWFKREPRNELERSTMLFSWENDHYFDWAIFNSELLNYQRVILFEKTYLGVRILSCALNIMEYVM